MLCLREGDLELTVRATTGETARVVPVQVRGDDRVDLVGPDAEAVERVQQAFRLAQRHLLRPLLTELGADARLADDDASIYACDQANAGAVDHVVPVGRLQLLPQDLRHDSEHKAPIRL